MRLNFGNRILKPDETVVLEAETLHVRLDTAGLAYRLRKTLAHMADYLRIQPDNLSLLRSLDGVIHRREFYRQSRKDGPVILQSLPAKERWQLSGNVGLWKQKQIREKWRL